MAQRKFVKAWADAILAEFELERMRKPVVNRRSGGEIYVIDGQHTIAALRQWIEANITHEWKIQKIDCEVYQGLTENEEADLFDYLNTRRSVASFQRFKVRVCAGRAEEVAIDKIVTDANLAISQQSNVPGAIGCVNTLSRVYARGGPEVLARTLNILHNAFGDPGLEGPLIDGIAHLCQRFNGSLDDSGAIVKLGGLHGGVNGLLNKAAAIRLKSGSPFAQCIAAAATEVINRDEKKHAKRLPSWWAKVDTTDEHAATS